MILESRRVFVRVIMLMVLLVSSSSYASTICSFNCPETGGGTVEALPQIYEIYSNDGSSLSLDTSGLIILDEYIFNTFSNLTINSLTPVYQGIDELPSGLALPETLQLNVINYTGGASFTGLESDVLLRQFDINAVLDLTASNGILIMDTNSLFAVPLPGAVWLFLGGLISLFSVSFKRQQSKR